MESSSSLHKNRRKATMTQRYGRTLENSTPTWKKLLESLNEKAWQELQYLLICLFAGSGKKEFIKDFPTLYEHFKEFVFKNMERTFR